jgi:hypothetical protein
LKNQYLTAKSDTAKINAGLKFFTRFYYPYSDSTINGTKLISEIFDLSRRAKHSHGLIESSFFLGSMLITQNMTSESIEYYFISMKQSEKVKDLVCRGLKWE